MPSAGPSRRQQPPASSLLDAVMGLYVPANSSVPTSALVAALEAHGVRPKAARQAIWRMTDAGLLQSERVGRSAHLRRTPLGVAEHTDAEDRIERFRADYTARRRNRRRRPTWVVLSVGHPGSDDLRQRLRRSLVGLGWASMAPGVWLNCGEHCLPAIRRVLDRAGIGATSTLAVGDLVPPTDVPALIARLWDLPALAARYRAFVETFAGVSPGSDREAFALRTALVATWRNFDADPVLPTDLLPPDWPGITAQDLIADRYRAWRGRADRWWTAAVESSTDDDHGG